MNNWEELIEQNSEVSPREEWKESMQGIGQIITLFCILVPELIKVEKYRFI